MTFSEYRSYQAPPGFRDELINGAIVLSPSASRKHADLCCRIYDLLKEQVFPSFVVRLDTTHRLGEREGPRPDVFVMSRERWVAADETDGYPEGSPEVAIEVLSASNSRSEMDNKRNLYFSDKRCREVWEVDEPAQTVTCYKGDQSNAYTLTDSIPISRDIGSGRVPVKMIFAGIMT